MFQLTHLSGFGVESARAPRFSYLTAYEDGAPATSDITGTALSIGEARDRTLCIVVSSEGTPVGANSCDVAGTYYGSLESIYTATSNGNSPNCVYLVDVPASAGTTADIHVDFSGGAPANAALAVYVSYDMYNGRAAEGIGGTNADPSVMTVNTQEPATIIAGSYVNSGTGTSSWSGLTENYDSQIGADAASCSFASEYYQSSGARSISDDFAAGSSFRTVGAVFTNWSKQPSTKILPLWGGSDTSAASSSRSVTGATIGEAASDRLIAVTIGYDIPSGSPTVSTVTIGGVSATIENQVISAAAGVGSAIAWAIVPSGTTATISATFSANVSTTRFDASRIKNYVSSTPIQSDVDSGLTTSLALAVNVPPRGVALGGYIDATNGGEATITGAFGYTYGAPGTIDAGGFLFQAGREDNSPRNITVTTSTANSAAVVASWR